MKKLFLLGAMVCALGMMIACKSGMASTSDGFHTQKVERLVSDFNIDGIDLSSPLNYYLSRAYVMSEGKTGLMAKMSSAKFELDTTEADETVDSLLRQRIFGEKILKIVTYKDSVAVVVTEDVDGWLLLNWCWLESGKWVNGGQGLAEDMSDADSQIRDNLPTLCRDLPRIALVASIPTDAKPFVDYLKAQTQSPEEFVLQQISTHQLVINGEYHRRKVSWDMLKRLLAMPEFPNVCGTIFMELPSREQPTMDSFLAAYRLNGEKILDIFRNEQSNGWWDKGEYEFICDVWRLNQSLPKEKRIRIVLADYQIPYSQIQTSDELRAEETAAKERNTHMADVVEQYINTKSDTRNCLFLVGCAHACKARTDGIASAGGDGKEQMQAGGQLAGRLGAKNVFTIFQHVLPRDNRGGHQSSIRGDVFDRAFAETGNRPVGFPLQGSPFGLESFDGIYEMKYKTDAGTYQDNFDGYLFLHPLEDEPRNEPLWEVFSDQFIAEMQRRSAYLGWDDSKDMWFGHNVSELTKEKIHQALTE